MSHKLTFLISQKVLHILMSQKLSFIMSQRLTEAATEGALSKKVSLEISPEACNFIKKCLL